MSNSEIDPNVEATESLVGNEAPLRFLLKRSGSGFVAGGAYFSSGTVVLEWLEEPSREGSGKGLSVYPGDGGLDDVISAHGGYDEVSIRWVDSPPALSRVQIEDLSKPLDLDTSSDRQED